jgi:hypothetical protein
MTGPGRSADSDFDSIYDMYHDQDRAIDDGHDRIGADNGDNGDNGGNDVNHANHANDPLNRDSAAGLAYMDIVVDQPTPRPRHNKLRKSAQSLRKLAAEAASSSLSLSSPAPPIPKSPPPSSPATSLRLFHSRSAAKLKPPQTPPPAPHQGLHHRPSSSGSSKVSPTPSSLPSVFPSEGEDPDAFHIRSTYAQLDVYGVRGDGYEDGVERTRARMNGASATSLVNPEVAPSGEKSQELNAKELETLASLDRYAPLLSTISCLSHHDLAATASSISPPTTAWSSFPSPLSRSASPV